MAGHSIFGIYTSRQGVEAAVQALQGCELPQFRHFRPGPGKPRRHSRYRHRQEHQSARRCDRRRHLRSGGWRGARMVGGHRCAGHPGHRAFLAAGPIMAALAGVGVGAAVGGIAGALVGFGVPEFEAKRYETRLRKGGILISVHADNHDWISRAKAILEKTGAEDVSSASESRVA